MGEEICLIGHFRNIIKLQSPENGTLRYTSALVLMVVFNQKFFFLD